MNESDQCSGVGRRDAFATSECPGHAALTEQLSQIGSTVSAVVIDENSWKRSRVSCPLPCRNITQRAPNDVKKSNYTRTMLIACGYVLVGSMSPVAAQSHLPAPSRTIYKCQVKGSVSYSDEPCIGAQRLESVPARGVDRLSGSARTGKDVGNEVQSEQFALAVRPLTGMSTAQFSTATRRHRLDAAVQRECSRLEPAILELEQAERHAGGAVMRVVQQDLFVLRQRYKKLEC